MKRRLHLSLLALVGSVLLFVFTSLAWLTVSEVINIDFLSSRLGDKELNYVLYESEDGINYSEITTISFDIAMPGDMKYYRLVLTNPSSEDYQVKIYLDGINDIMSDGSDYIGPTSLTEVVHVKTIINSEVNLENELALLIDNPNSARISDNVFISANASETVDFQFSILGSAGNEYQNLGIEIDAIKFYFNAL